MINIFVGRPGTGKTYTLVKEALRAVRQGRDVYSNFHLDFSSINPELNKRLHFWDSIDQLVRIKQGLILVDECQIYFNSRDWKNLPARVQYKFQQHRKQGLDIYGAVQNIKRIDTVIRELVNWVFEVRRVGIIFVQTRYIIDDIDKARRQGYGTKIYFLRKKIACCYDTFQEIASADF